MHRYARRSPTIEAAQHDGSDSSAVRLETWVNSCGECGATAILKGTADYTDEAAFIRLDISDRPQNLVGPTWWIVRIDNGGFYTIPDKDFQLLYFPDPIFEESQYG